MQQLHGSVQVHGRSAELRDDISKGVGPSDIGPMHVEEGDVFGGTMNFAARVIGSFKGAEIWLSDRPKKTSIGSVPSSTNG
jgi:class 3 adenylate cyclase